MPIPHFCRYASDYRRETGSLKLWNPDQCANAVFLPTRRPVEHEPEPGVERNPGSFVIGSAHPIRAVYDGQLNNDQEHCKLHYGKLALNTRGYAIPYFCSKPNTGSQRTNRGFVVRNGRKPRLGVTEAACSPGDPRLGNVYYPINTILIRPGYFGIVAAYDAPAVAEIHLGGTNRACGGIYR